MVGDSIFDNINVNLVAKALTNLETFSLRMEVRRCLKYPKVLLWVYDLCTPDLCEFRSSHLVLSLKFTWVNIINKIVFSK